MQILKEYIREDILSSAKRIFLEKGFRGTKMRDIAETVGISTSNLYNYFPSKIELYTAIVDRTANHVLYIVTRYREVMDLSKKDEILPRMVQEIYELMSEEQESLLLVLSDGEDTKYAQLPDQVLESLDYKFSHLIKREGATGLTSKMIANNLFASMVYILKNCQSKEEIYENLNFLFSYHVAGLSALAE